MIIIIARRLKIECYRDSAAVDGVEADLVLSMLRGCLFDGMKLMKALINNGAHSNSRFPFRIFTLSYRWCFCAQNVQKHGYWFFGFL